MDYFIDSIVQHGPAIKEFRLVPADGGAAPAWSAGAHVELDIRSQSGASYRNAYSLIGEPGEQLPQTWRVRELLRQRGGGPASASRPLPDTGPARPGHGHLRLMGGRGLSRA